MVPSATSDPAAGSGGAMATACSSRRGAVALVIASALACSGLSASGAYGATQSVQHGSVHCSSAAGKVAFSPPLTSGGEAADTDTVTLTFTEGPAAVGAAR